MHASVLLLADGRFPAGGHAYSAGVESAVDVGDVHDLASLERYLDGRLALGVVEAAFAASAVAAALRADPELIVVLDDEFDARVLSPRLCAVSRRLGRQLVRAGAAIWPTAALTRLAESSDGPHQPVALGAAVAAAGGAAADAAAVSLHHLAAAVCTAGVRLLGLDPLAVAAAQSRSLRCHAPGADDVAGWVAASPSDLPAFGGSLTEILGEMHGEWDARLFVA
jgi:urease accessory protein